MGNPIKLNLATKMREEKTKQIIGNQKHIKFWEIT
jgi:hypothetical protein